MHRTLLLLILLRTVGARRAERACVVRRPPVACVANAAQNAVGEVCQARRVQGTRLALKERRVRPNWPVSTGAAVCTACLPLLRLELARSTGSTGPPCRAREARVARAVRRGVVLQAPRRVRRTLLARTRGRTCAVVLPGAREARDGVRHLGLVRACLARQTRWKCNFRYEAAATEIASLRRINAVDCE